MIMMRWLLLLVLFAACSSENNSDNQETAEAGEDENALHIHFQKGFHQDTVILYNGREKIYEKVLTSQEPKGPTDQFSIPKEQIRDTIYFKVKQEGKVLNGYIPPKAEQYVGFFLTSGSVVNIYSRPAPFEYQ